MTRRRIVSVLGAVAVLTATTLGTSPGGAAVAAPATGAKVTSGPGVWVQLSSGTGMENISDPSLHRFGSSLQVVWNQDGAGGTDALHTRILAASGAPASANKTLVRWGAVNEFPVIFASGSQRVIAFSGLQNTNETNPYAQGYGYYLTSSNGTAWTLANATLGSDVAVENSYGTDATDAAGTPVITYTGGFDVAYHAGFDSLPPKTTDHLLDAQPGHCCTYYTGVGYDPKSGQTWSAWYSNSGEAATDGVDAERLLPSVGKRVHAPLSTTKYDGEIDSVDPEQRVGVVARHGGGLYTAYGVGYPSQNTIALWKLGDRKPLVIKTHDAIAFPGVAATQDGRLWVYWYARNTGLLHAVRTNTAGTRLGAISSVRPPRGTTEVWKTAGDAGVDALDLVVNASVGYSSKGEQLFATQVLPRLSGRVSPGTVRSARGGKVTVTITDAGVPVRGALVRYKGTTKRTNKRGQVIIVVAKGAPKRRYAVTFEATGLPDAAGYGNQSYTGGTLHFRVT